MNRHVFGKSTVASKMCGNIDQAQHNKCNAHVAADWSDLLPRIILIHAFSIVDVVIESFFGIIQIVPAHKILLY